MLPVFGIVSGGNGFLVRGAAVQIDELPVHLNVRLPSRGFVTPNSLSASAVVVVEGAGSTSEVGHSVVQPLSIYVVNLVRGLLPVMEKPSESVGKNLLPSERDVPVSVLVDCTGFTADDGVPVNLFDPSKTARFGTVLKELTGFLWDNFRSHFKVPLDLVRGVGDCNPRPSDYTSLGVFC